MGAWDYVAAAASVIGIVGGIFGLLAYLKRHRYSTVQLERLHRPVYAPRAFAMLANAEAVEKLGIDCRKLAQGVQLSGGRQIEGHLDTAEIPLIAQKLEGQFQWIKLGKENSGIAAWQLTRSGRYMLFINVAGDGEAILFKVEMGRLYPFRIDDGWNLSWSLIMETPRDL